VRVEFSTRAAADVDEVLQWYASKSLSAAEGYLQAVEHAVAVVSDGPEIWPAFEAGTQRYVSRRYPFSLIYRVYSDYILVVAVAPHRKRPGYWQSSDQR
jgi:plasmid stabilization system protein ParE